MPICPAKAARNNRAAFCIVLSKSNAKRCLGVLSKSNAKRCLGYNAKRCLGAMLCREFPMPITTIIIIVLILVLIGAVPAWPHSRSWGYGPSGILGVVLVVLLVLVLMGRV